MLGRRSGLVAVAIAGVVLTISIVVPAIGGQTADRASVGSTAKKALKLAKKANKNAKKALKQLGAQPPAGPSEAVTTRATGNITVTTSASVVSLNLPAGSWVVNARVDGVHTGAASTTRLECSLSGPDGVAVDYEKLRLAANNTPDALVFASVSLHGAVTLASPGTVKANCGSTAGSGIELTTRNMTAIKVGSLTTQ